MIFGEKSYQAGFIGHKKFISHKAHSCIIAIRRIFSNDQREFYSMFRKRAKVACKYINAKIMQVRNQLARGIMNQVTIIIIIIIIIITIFQQKLQTFLQRYCNSQSLLMGSLWNQVITRDESQRARQRRKIENKNRFC